MRIISGKSRGTKLYTLEGIETRPTLDRVKESIFNIIQSEIPDSIILDLFSGSGAIGLELVSRGAKKAILCDSSKDAIKIIKKNIEKTHVEKEVEIYNEDFRKLIPKIQEPKIDIVYLDPPYKTTYIKQALEKLLVQKYITEETLIIVETDEIDRVLEEIKQLEKINIKTNIVDKRKYGRVHIIFLKRL